MLVRYLTTTAAKRNVNAAKPLQVCSGLVDYIPIERMSEARVVVVTNLKPSKMRGVKSEAMLLAAEKEVNNISNVSLITPHENTPIGSALHFKGFDSIEKAPRLKSQLWQELQSKLRTSENGTVVFDNDHPLVDEHGNPATSVPNAGVR
ncbi:hypothetical protein QA089_004401 [Meyerozyma guilliermondii]